VMQRKLLFHDNPTLGLRLPWCSYCPGIRSASPWWQLPGLPWSGSFWLPFPPAGTWAGTTKLLFH
jgi:hypothetical protein